MKIKRRIVKTLLIFLAVIMTALPTYAAKIRTVDPKSGNNKVGDLFRAGKSNCKHVYPNSSKKRYPSKGTIFRDGTYCVYYNTFTCKKCKREFISSVHRVKHKKVAEKGVGSSFKPTCTSFGYTKYCCGYCGNSMGIKITKAKGHTPVWKETKKYNSKKKCYVKRKYRVCKNCRCYLKRQNGKYVPCKPEEAIP